MAGNAHKRKGDLFERDTVAALIAMGVPSYRTLSAGIPHDAGDVHAGQTFTISCKDRTYWSNMNEWMDAVKPMVEASRRHHGALVMKRIRKPVTQAYVIMTLEDLAALIRIAEE